jgi:hypothetical protein
MDEGKGVAALEESKACGEYAEAVRRSIQSVRVAPAAQATRRERSSGVVGSAPLQLVQGKAMKSRQMVN